MTLYRIVSRSMIALAAVVVVVQGACVQTAKADLINLDLSGIANVPPEVVARFGQAEQFWEERLIGYSAELPRYILRQLRQINIDARGVGIDGIGGILGQAAPTDIFRETLGRRGGKNGENFNIAISQGGFMEFDTDDYGPQLQLLPVRVMIHEMGHVLGFGSLWEDQDNTGLLTVRPQDPRGGPTYIGKYGLEKFREQTGNPLARYVPLEKLGGPGTRDSHVDSQHAYFARRRAVMGGFDVGPNWTFTDTSWWMMRDLHFATPFGEVGNYGQGPVRRGDNGKNGPPPPSFLRGGDSNSVPEPTSVGLIGLIGLVGLGFARRRRRDA